jgi:hypothetical protein
VFDVGVQFHQERNLREGSHQQVPSGANEADITMHIPITFTFVSNSQWLNPETIQFCAVNRAICNST